MKKRIFITLAFVFALGALGAAVLYSGRTAVPGGDPGARAEGVATVENGVQYVDILARGGYTPRLTKAQAGIPTVLRMRTENTFDCSSALVIPALNYSSFLKPADAALITVPVEKAQGTLEGMCSMGMYRFSVVFE